AGTRGATSAEYPFEEIILVAVEFFPITPNSVIQNSNPIRPHLDYKKK
ncbi:6265_t:CDS:1, partial [Acaulospora morrowiae]